jgi:thymidylate synthase (FAD)
MNVINYGFGEEYLPSWLNLHEKETNNVDHLIGAPNGELQWGEQMLLSEITYNQLLKQGWSPQQARSVLPNSLKTEIIVKANLREWREIFKQRTSDAAHPDMRVIMRSLLDEVKTKIPIIFDDINY